MGALKGREERNEGVEKRFEFDSTDFGVGAGLK